MCIDANAGARQAARERWMQKDAKYRSESLKYWNRETSAVRGMQRAATGYSRAISNDYQRALYVQGQARKAYQAGFIKYYSNKASVDEGGRDRRATKKGLVALTRARGQLDNAVQREFGVQMQRRYRARTLQFQSAQAKAREAVGVRPEYGAPVMMPPTDRLSGALSIAGSIISIAGGLKGLGAFGGTKAVEGFNTLNSLSAIGSGLSGLGGINQQSPVTVGGGILGLDPTYEGLLNSLTS